MMWYIKPPFDGIFTQQYLYQKLLESDNYVEIIVGGRVAVVSFFETQCRKHIWQKSSAAMEFLLGPHVRFRNFLQDEP